MYLTANVAHITFCKRKTIFFLLLITEPRHERKNTCYNTVLALECIGDMRKRSREKNISQIRLGSNQLKKKGN